MDDEIRIGKIQPYPRNRDGKNSESEEQESGSEEPRPIDRRDDDPEVKDGHIDTRVAPDAPA